MRQLRSEASAKSIRAAESNWVSAPRSGLAGGFAFGGQAFVAEKLLLERMMASLGNPCLRIVLWDGQEIAGMDGEPVACMTIRDRGALLKLIANPEYWFGEMYTAGRIEVHGDLVDFIETIYRSLPRGSQGSLGQKLLAPFYDVRRNSLPKARSNIHHHYDIGNAFYKLWLDGDMVYTCAYFPDRDMDLEAGQTAKLDHVCRKLQLTPGESVVEAGCGWGALALHMAGHYGVHVKAYNISTQQIAHARQRAGELGLSDRVEFIEDDYRNIRGEFDAFVSIGMLEHIGAENYPGLGMLIQRSLKPTGRGLIHSIGRDHPSSLNPWIEKRIFPGACPPSLSQLMQILEPFGFSVLDVENLRLHYAKTLEHWLARYEKVADQVSEMFDASFVRAWRLYLAGSLAAFRSGDMQLFQVCFTHSGYNRIPWTRHYQYLP